MPILFQARLLLQDPNLEESVAIAKADAVYESGLRQFEASSTVHVVYAQYLHSYKKNRHLEMSQLAAAERKVR